MGEFVEQLRELKSLLDEGIITQNEYDAKKKQILGIDGPSEVVVVEKANPFTIEDGVLVSYEGNSAIVDVPEDVDTVGVDCFAYHTEIREIRFKRHSINEIQRNAFRGCENLKYIKTSGSLDCLVSRICSEAFYECNNLIGP